MANESFGDLNAMGELFEAAAEKTASAVVTLTKALAGADATFGEWAPEVKTAWTKGLGMVFAKVDRPERITAEMEELVKAMMHIGVDGAEPRRMYALYFNYLYPRTDAADDVLQAIGLADQQQAVADAARRFDLYAMLRMREAKSCFDKEHGKGAVISLDCVKEKSAKGARKAADEREKWQVKILQDKTRSIDLKPFLDNFALVVCGSYLDRVMDHRNDVEHFVDEAELMAAMLSGVRSMEPVMADDLRRMLVPAVLSQTSYEALARPAVARAAVAAEVHVVEDANGGRWDNSRSVAELQTRLTAMSATKASLAVDAPNLDNVEALLERESVRTDSAHEALARQWVEAVAMLRQSELFNERLTALLTKLSANGAVTVWNDLEFFVELVDKMSKTLIPSWMKVTMEVKGKEFLVDATMKLPQSLWIHSEKLLELDGSRQMLEERVFQDFEEGHPTNDHYCWLWKSSTKDPRKAEYIGNAYLLFRTLHLEVRGNYLKSQRAMHKLLMDDVKFQQALMRGGDEGAVQNLIRCIKHRPLLDASERQSLLVKIVRSYPQHRRLVEEHVAPAASRVKPARSLTSSASFRRLKAELKELIEVLQPQNTKAIEEARALGDLSENAEYKSAKELQRELGRRRSFMERQLETLMEIDFSQQQPADVVIPGCMVTLKYAGAAEDEKLYLLGVLDGDAQKRFFSYESPLGQLLIGKRVGDKFTAPNGDEVNVVKIEPLPQTVLDELA